VQIIVAVADPERVGDGPLLWASSLDGWRPDGRPIPRVAPGVYAATLTLPAGGRVDYKLLRRADWATVAKAADGGELPNHVLHVPSDGRRVVALHTVARWADDVAAPAVEFVTPVPTAGGATRPSTRTGEFRTHRIDAAPPRTHARELLVYLPPDYAAQPEARFPVVYLHDGQNVFDAATSFSGVEWGADEAVEVLSRAGCLPPCIVVGVANTPARIGEYTPHVDGRRGGGDGAAYLELLTVTIKPLVDRTYRTRPERAHTTIGGSSLGGLISLAALARHGDVFGGYLVLAPSLQWADYAIVEELADVAVPPGTRVWIELGRGDDAAAETPTRYVAAGRRVAERLRAAGAQVHYAEHAGDFHHERDWAARLPSALRFVVGDAWARGTAHENGERKAQP